MEGTSRGKNWFHHLKHVLLDPEPSTCNLTTRTFYRDVTKSVQRVIGEIGGEEEVRLRTNVKVQLENVRTLDRMSATALVDSGAMGNFISKQFIREQAIETRKLDKEIRVLNIDGTPNKGGNITEIVELRMIYRGYEERIELGVCDTGRATLILGHPWLWDHNPEVDWRKGEIKFTRCGDKCGKHWEIGDNVLGIFIRAARTVSQELAQKALEELGEIEVEIEIPDYLQEFESVFSEEEFKGLPPHRKWDHRVDLKPGSNTDIQAKVYPMTFQETQELNAFLDENLASGRIRRSE